MFIRLLTLAFFVLSISSQNNKEGNNELQSMKRNSCLLITRNYLHSKQDDLGALLKDVYQSQMKQYLDKLHASIIEKCERQISQSEGQEFYSQNNDNFDITNFYYLVSDASFVDIMSDLTLTWEEKQILEFSKSFDEHHGIKPEEEVQDDF